MSTVAVRIARPWFHQADSDARTAEALLSQPVPMRSADVGCHVAAMCAQSIEKSLKGYVFLNGGTPAMDHRPDKYLSSLLVREDPLLRHKDHHRYLAALFDPETKARVRELFDLTPGGLGSRNDVPNTEYPWTDAETIPTPVDSRVFADKIAVQQWLDTAKRVTNTLHKLWIAVDRATAL